MNGIAASNGVFYVAHDQYDAATDAIFFEISKLAPHDKNWTVLYRSPPLDTNYYAAGDGGKLAIDSKLHRLYFSVGDFSLDRINHLPSDVAPQNPQLPWGKINYIDLNDGSYHPYSLGHRNPMGLIVLKNGELWESENGPRGGDELNRILEGKNYGWPYNSYGTVYNLPKFGRYRDALKVPKGLTYEEPVLCMGFRQLHRRNSSRSKILTRNGITTCSWGR